MRSSATDPRESRGTGTWLRLAVLLLLVVLALVPSAADLTGALLTDTATATTVVSTLPEFAPPEP